MSNLVIVESPTKIATIKGYLGSNYKVMASKGHVRDLPKSTLGVDIDNGFEAHYINIRGKGDVIKEIKKEAKNANKVFLATDPDREGEAISWHLATALGIPMEKAMRITFNEVTKTAVKAAIKSPRPIDMNLVNSQQTRRILDRIVGYKLSPYLWKTVRSGLSAGRVQSVATRIIVEREEEIRSFVPVEYWTIEAHLSHQGKEGVVAKFYGNRDGRIKLGCEADAMKVLANVEGKPFLVDSVKKSVKHKAPAPPFTTSTLQQEASRKLGFQSARIMKVAQELYEGVNLGSENGGTQGLITYMRTDSLRVSEDAQQAAKELICSRYGGEYYPKTTRVYKTKSGAQDAHEAIRPARVELLPADVKKYLTADQFKLYKLIWERFISSQMQSATLNSITVNFSAGDYLFRTGGYTVTFAGYMAVYEVSEEETHTADDLSEEKNLKIPALEKGEALSASKIDPEKHFTEPPPRYNEASLVKFLEEKGIGRPSTYTPIITTIIARNYVKRDGRALVPTQLGEITTKLMKEHFPDVVNYKFTAKMENQLDAIEEGRDDMKRVLSAFWGDFEKELKTAEASRADNTVEVPVEETDLICDKCGSRMIVKKGRYGKFAACPNYPQCKNTKPLNGDTAATEEKKTVAVPDMKCEKCGSDMVLRNGKFGSFYACSKYPACKFTKQKNRELDVPCPICSSKLVIKHGKNKSVFYSCEKYPTCQFSSWDMPINESCPQCGHILFRKKGKDLLVCNHKGCGYKRETEKNDTDEK